MKEDQVVQGFGNGPSRPGKAVRKTSTNDPRVETTEDFATALNVLLADVFALYLKTKNFHWHVSGPHFRDYHLWFDQQAEQILAIADVVAERVRIVGRGTLRSIGHVSRLQRLSDNDEDRVSARDMLAYLREDNLQLAMHMRQAHGLCDHHGDLATASLIDEWIAEAEIRAWSLHQATNDDAHQL